MQKRYFLAGILVVVGVIAAFAQQTPQTASLAAVAAPGKLNETLLHKTVLDYSFPQELAGAVRKCTDGEPEACYIALKGFESASQPSLAAAANLELAVLAMQRGLVHEALAHIDTASRLNPDDPFIQLTKGWQLLSAGKYKKARQAFDDLLFLTADFEYVSSAKLGKALAWYEQGHKTQAATELQYLYTSNPYAISFVSFMLGKIASELKNSKKLAPVFLQQALSHDERNYAAADLYAKLSEKEKNDLRAWQYYATLYSLDPANKKLAEKIEDYQKAQGDKSIDYLFYLRLEQPIVHVLPSTPSTQVRMALYADHTQTPQALTELTVVGSGNFTVQDEKRGAIFRAPAYVEKKMVFNPQSGALDFLDAKGNLEFSAKRPFTISPDNTARTLLVRNARAVNIFAAAFDDKELKGSLTVIPGQSGFTLVNTVFAEDLIPALLATRAQSVKQPAALTALAVVFRTALLDALQDHASQPYHITDNDPAFRFKGINLIFNNLLQASKLSGALRLTKAQAGFYESCGVVTADSLQNTVFKPAYRYSPANVSKYILSNPPADLYARPQDPTQWAQIKWIYSFDARDIENRLSYKHPIGKLRALVPVKLTPNGRILTMRFEGSKGAYETQSAQETAFILSAGTMRSNLFDIVPLYKGKNIKSVLVRGYDTGLGNGLCLQGADGLARQGADATAIIKYYFPQARILNTQTGALH